MLEEEQNCCVDEGGWILFQKILILDEKLYV
jgi:hypothetical protein